MIDFIMSFVCFAFGLGSGYFIGKNYQKKKEQNFNKLEPNNLNS